MKIDINADVGEGIDNEELLMPYLSSCNIACGGHFGDEKTMNNAIAVAMANNVKIGAHPSFPDKANFGRQPMPLLSNSELLDALKNQLSNFVTVANSNNIKLHHVKPHGALYNLAATTSEIANVIIQLMRALPKEVKLYAPFGSVIETLALQNNIPIVYEVFADRNYNDDYTLVSRSKSKALLTNPESVFKHVYHLYSTQSIKTISGKILPIKANTYCIHGDNKAALVIAKHLFDKLSEKNITVDKV